MDYEKMAVKALEDLDASGVQVQRGIGYALLALRETQEMMGLPWEPVEHVGIQLENVTPPGEQLPRETLEQAEAAVEEDTLRRAEDLAKAILDRQLEMGEATVTWDSRGQSRELRIAAAQTILEGAGLPRDQLVAYLAQQFNWPCIVADQVLWHADAVLNLSDQPPGEDVAEMRNLLLDCGWELHPGADEDAEDVYAIFGDYGPMPLREAVQLISDEGRGIKGGFGIPDQMEELRAKADAILYGTGYVCGGRRLPPARVRVFRSAAARGTLTS